MIPPVNDASASTAEVSTHQPHVPPLPASSEITADRDTKDGAGRSALLLPVPLELTSTTTTTSTPTFHDDLPPASTASLVGESVANHLHLRAPTSHLPLRPPDSIPPHPSSAGSPLDHLLGTPLQLRRTDTAATVRLESAKALDVDVPAAETEPATPGLRVPLAGVTSPRPILVTPTKTLPNVKETATPHICINPASEINSRIDTQVEVKVYPCNANGNAMTSHGKKKFTQFTVKPEGIVIQGSNRRNDHDVGAEYARHIGRKLPRYDLADTRASQLLVTSHAKNFWVVPAPEAFSRHSGTCRLLGDRKHPATPHPLQVGDFLRVGSVGVVVIETNNGHGKVRSLSEDKIQKIMKDTAAGGFIDLEDEAGGDGTDHSVVTTGDSSAKSMGDEPMCYMCFDDTNTEDNPLITPCQCLGDTRYVHVDCLRKWHSAEADNQICFLSSVDATCSVCKTTFKSDFKLPNGKTVKLFKSSLEPPYVSLLIATKHEMAQRLFNTRFQLSFSTLLKPDRRNAVRPLLLGRSSGSDMVLDYRTVSARHASLKFKNGEFLFTDAGSSNGSYLYLRRPLELTSSQPVQFRLGRSMIAMKVVHKWNRRFLRAVRRTYSSSEREEVSNFTNEDEGGGLRRTRSGILNGLPPLGQLMQSSPVHLDLLHALAYPKRVGLVQGGGKKAEAAGLGGVDKKESRSQQIEALNQLLQENTLHETQAEAQAQSQSPAEAEVPGEAEKQPQTQELVEYMHGIKEAGDDATAGINRNDEVTDIS